MNSSIIEPTTEDPLVYSEYDPTEECEYDLIAEKSSINVDHVVEEEGNIIK